MSVQDQTIEIFLDFGITRVYSGFLPLVTLVKHCAYGKPFTHDLVESVAKKYQISVSTLRQRIQTIARRMHKTAPLYYEQLSGSIHYHMDTLVLGLADEVLKRFSQTVSLAPVAQI